MMDYVKILSRILEIETMENVYCGFVDGMKEHSILNVISTDGVEEIVSYLAKERPTEYQVDKKEFATYYYLEETILTRSDMNKYQNMVGYVKDYDDGNFQILIKECGGNCQVWLYPLFFKEFYEYCVEVLDGIKPSPSAEKIKRKEERR